MLLPPSAVSCSFCGCCTRQYGIRALFWCDPGGQALPRSTICVTLFDGLVLETSGIILLESQAVWVYFTSGSLYKDIPECEHVSHIHKTVVSGRFKIAGPAVVDTGLFNSFLTWRPRWILYFASYGKAVIENSSVYVVVIAIHHCTDLILRVQFHWTVTFFPKVVCCLLTILRLDF